MLGWREGRKRKEGDGDGEEGRRRGERRRGKEEDVGCVGRGGRGRMEERVWDKCVVCICVGKKEQGRRRKEKKMEGKLAEMRATMVGLGK